MIIGIFLPLLRPRSRKKIMIIGKDQKEIYDKCRAIGIDHDVLPEVIGGGNRDIV